MNKQQKSKDRLKRDPTMDTVLAGFRLQGTSFHDYCQRNNIKRRNAEHALKGIWCGKKGLQLREKILSDSQANTLLKLKKPKKTTKKFRP